ncbi:MAG: hypothetical protein IPN33_06500 [Saprospiraceae bacterium]|nr:hypothetical protein [Saprospiraceae bacterium]
MKKLIQWSLLGLFVVLLMGACSDPNEGSVADTIDFKRSKVEFDAGSASILTTLWFYGNYGGKEFFYYFNTDQDAGADFLVRCSAGVFTVSKESSPGLYNILMYTGKPTVSGNMYKLSFPVSALEVSGEFTVRYWFFEISEGDRMPDGEEVKSLTVVL